LYYQVTKLAIITCINYTLKYICLETLYFNCGLSSQVLQIGQLKVNVNTSSISLNTNAFSVLWTQ